MGALQNISDLITANTGKKDRLFKYFLSNSVFGTIELRFAPDGWRDGELTYQRDEVYGGVFRKYSTNELVFVKDSRDFLQNVYEAQGISAECTFTVQILNRSTFEYEDYFEGKVDFTTYAIEETGVRVSIIDDSFTEKFKSRDELDLNVLDDTGIDGGVFPTIAIRSLVLKDKTRYRYGEYDDSGTLYVLNIPPALPAAGYTLMLPKMGRTVNEFDESVEFPGGFTSPLSESMAFLRSAAYEYPLNLNGAVQFQFQSLAGGVLQARVELWTDESGSWQAEHTVASGSFLATTSPYLYYYNMIWSGVSYTLPAGASAALIVRVDQHTLSNFLLYSFSFTFYARLLLQQNIITAVPAYEAFWKVAQKMTGLPAPIISTLFGRTNTPNFYPVDGEVPFFTRGGLIRKMGDDPGTLALSFRKLFLTLHSIYRIGVGVEQSAGKKLRIELEDYFYDSAVILDLTDRVREAAIRKEVMPEKHYNELKFGYESFNYASSGGLREYNTTSLFTTSVNNLKNSLNQVSPYRGDTSGIDAIREAMARGDAGNTEGDKDIWLIDARKDGTSYSARRGKTVDGFTLVSGGLGADEGFNLRFTPKRNLLRWGRHIKAGLSKYLGTYLRWQTSDRFTGLETQLSSEFTPVVESSDQLVKLLDPNRFYPEKYVFEAPLYWEDIQAIEANPRGMIKIGANKYGWILRIQTNSREKMAEFELLRVNTSTVTPT